MYSLAPLLAFLHWAPDPEIFEIGIFAPRWYGLCFALGFLAAYTLGLKVFRREGRTEYDVYQLFLYIFVGTIVGARLGHCLFYQPEYFLSHPFEIFKFWEGGLASHGGTAGVMIAVWLYARKRKMNLLWLMDRLTIIAPLVAAFIRLGNFFNSEIVGSPSELPWAVVFERVDLIPRHPAQMYEALWYLLTFVLVWGLYRKHGRATPRGLISGVMFLMIFGFRFFVEFIKMDQVGFEANLPLNMGQLLSIPFVILGLWLWNRSRSANASAH